MLASPAPTFLPSHSFPCSHLPALALISLKSWCWIETERPGHWVLRSSFPFAPSSKYLWRPTYWIGESCPQTPQVLRSRGPPGHQGASWILSLAGQVSASWELCKPILRAKSAFHQVLALCLSFYPTLGLCLLLSDILAFRGSASNC